MAIKMDGHTITELKLKASDGSEVTKQLTEEGTIPTPTGSLNITSNGTYDVTDKASAVVNVPAPTPTLQDKTITENGTYSASADDADGYSSVTVNVSGGGYTLVQTDTITEDKLTVESGGNALAVADTYLPEDNAAAMILIKNNLATEYQAKWVSRLYGHPMALRGDDELRPSITHSTSFFMTAGSIVEVYKIELPPQN